jgi:hypothetical protein
VDVNYIKMEQMIDTAKESKLSFIYFINEIGITQVCDWVTAWLKKFWTDGMSRIFFDTYWNGSLDIVTLCVGGSELPSLLDDICKCMDASYLN